MLEPDNGLVVYRIRGTLSVDAMIDLFRRSKRDPDWSDDHDFLSLLHGTEFGDITVPEVDRLLGELRGLDTPRADGRRKRSAVVCPDWVARALLTYWEHRSETVRLHEDSVFATEAEARAWLAEVR